MRQLLCQGLRIAGAIARFDNFVAKQEREQEQGANGKRTLAVKSRSMSI